MKGTLHKTEQGWQVSHATYDMTINRWTAGKFLVHPDYIKYYFLDEDAEGSEVEFEIINKLWGVNDDIISYAKLIKPKKINLEEMPKEEWEEARNPAYKHFDIDVDYPELEGTITLCNDKIWDDIYDEYSMEQYPPFGGPFTNSLSFIHWLKQNYKAPQNRIK